MCNSNCSSQAGCFHKDRLNLLMKATMLPAEAITEPSFILAGLSSCDKILARRTQAAVATEYS
eukprot:3295287-Pleurochrysis_carterae.AAC.1